MESIPLKRCSRCKKELPPTTEYFHKRSSTRDGLRPECKACRVPDSQKYYQENAERISEYVADWRKAHPDKCNEYNERWKRNRRHVYLAGRKRRYNEQAPARRNEARMWRIANPEKARIQWRVRQARERAAQGNHTPDDIRMLYKSQRGKCWWCSKPVGDDYHVDHRIAITRGGSNNPSNLCITCEACNLSKNNKLPHEWSDRLL